MVESSEFIKQVGLFPPSKAGTADMDHWCREGREEQAKDHKDGTKDRQTQNTTQIVTITQTQKT